MKPTVAMTIELHTIGIAARVAQHLANAKYAARREGTKVECIADPKDIIAIVDAWSGAHDYRILYHRS